MAYECQCGNNERFYEAFDVAIDVVDGEGHYEEFWDGVAHANANAE